jgi:ubiquinone/menaquinone biosynthesis C-methylase UbiE
VTEPPAAGVDLREIYELRFSDEDAAQKDLIWREIGRFLQRFVPSDAVILDIACDRGDFIRSIKGRERWATDQRDVRAQLPGDIEFVRANGLELDRVLPNSHFDVAFMSNYLEHRAASSDVVEQVGE